MQQPYRASQRLSSEGSPRPPLPHLQLRHPRYSTTPEIAPAKSRVGGFSIGCRQLSRKIASRVPGANPKLPLCRNRQFGISLQFAL